MNLYHKSNLVCTNCQASGHSTQQCIKIQAKKELLEKQRKRREARMELDRMAPKLLLHTLHLIKIPFKTIAPISDIYNQPITHKVTKSYLIFAKLIRKPINLNLNNSLLLLLYLLPLRLCLFIPR